MNCPQVENAAHGWVPRVKDKNQYIQVFFSGIMKNVTRVQVQGRGSYETEYPTEIEIQGFMQNGKWEKLHQGKTNLQDRDSIHTIHAKDFSENTKQTTIICGGIRIFVRDFNRHPSMRCEVWIKGMNPCQRCC